MTARYNKSVSPLMTLAAQHLFLKVYDLGFASKTSKALPGAVWSEGIFKFPSHSRVAIHHDKKGQGGKEPGSRGLPAGEAV